MNITKFSIKHSTSIFILFLLLVYMGYNSIKTIPIELFPDVQQPMIIVSTIYKGVSPEDMETLVTDKIEKRLKELQYVDEITSTSDESVSSIVVKFIATVDTEWALSKVKDKVDIAKTDLPKDAEIPIVKEIAFSEFPVVIINFSGDLPLTQLKEIAEDYKEDLETMPGVLRADLSGGREREIQIIIDPIKLISYQIDISGITTAISQTNINIPGGVVKIGDMRYNIRVPGEIKDVSLLDNVIVKNESDVIVYLRDVALIVDSYKDTETISRFNGKESVSISLVKKSGSNILEVIESSKKLIEERLDTFPEGLKVNFLSDSSTHIKDMIKELANNLITGVLLIIVFLFFFMGFINSLFVAIALPLSMVIGISVIQFIGASINMIVLFGLILSSGMLVDNAIVVIENIFRQNTLGIPRQYAAYKATREVAWPIIGSTATTVAVFVPLLFWYSIMGRFMQFLPIVLIATLSMSLFIALSLNPVLAATFMKVKQKDIDRLKKSENYDEFLASSRAMKFYKKLITFAVRFRGTTVISMIVLFIITVMVFGKNNKGVQFFTSSTPETAVIKIEAPVGTRLEVVDERYIKIIEQKLLTYEDITSVISNAGSSVGSNKFVQGGGSVPHNGKITINFKKLNEFKKSPYIIIEEIREYAKQFSGAIITVEIQQNGPPKGKPVQLSITGDDFGVSKEHITAVTKIIEEKVKGAVDLVDDFSAGMPELQIKVNRETAKRFHLSVYQIAADIRTAIYGGIASKYRVDKDEYDIMVKYPQEKRQSLEDIKNIQLPVRVMNRYDIVPLNQVADFEFVKGFSAIKHRDYKRAITITGDVQGITSDKAMNEIKELLKDYKLPSGYKIIYGGESKDQAEASSFLSKAFLIGIMLILFVLVLQFNSILMPLVILFSVVLSLIGVLWSILLTDSYFVVVMTGIGVISLAGVVVNNAIVLIDYIQQLRREGLGKNEAIIRAGITRFRPVMLTAVTTVFGLLPMMAGMEIDFVEMHFSFSGSSGEWWKPMANAVGYGLIFATVLTLIVVPATYSIADSFGELMRKLFRRPVQNFDDDKIAEYDKIK